MSLRVGARNISKAFGSVHAVSDVTIEFEPGRIHAVLGENGAGKTTLMKLLFGMHAPSSGEVMIDGAPVVWRSPMDAIHRGLGMVQQHFSLVDQLSAIDNVMLGSEVARGCGWLDRKRAIASIEALLPDRSLAVPWHAPVSELAVGQKQKVEILKLLFREARVLFFDEPTAVLAPQEIKEFFSLLASLRDAGHLIVLITHKIGEVLEICDSYAVMRAGRLVASAPVAAASGAQIVAQMIGCAPRAASPARTTTVATSALRCVNLSEKRTHRDAARGINLVVNEGEIVGIAGVEGSGQSSLVDAIFGLRSFVGEIEIFGQSVASGAIGRARRLGCGLIPEDRLQQGAWPDESVRSNMIVGLQDRFAGRLGWFDRSAIARVTDAWASEFDVRARQGLNSAFASLSGGNQQKVVFAREIAGFKPKIFICHQPTRGLDLGAIDALHRRLIELRNQGVAVLVLSSELEELISLSDRIYAFFDGRSVAEFARGTAANDAFDRMAIGSAMTGARRL